MAIDNSQFIQSTALEQSFQSCIQRGPLTSWWSQTANPNFELVILHGEDPSIAVGDPLAAEHETETVSPSFRGSIISLEDPFASLPGEEWIRRRINIKAGLMQQNATGSRRIHQMGIHTFLTGFAVGVDPHRSGICVKPQQSNALPGQKLHSGLDSLIPQPAPQGREVENNSARIFFSCSSF